MEDLFGQIECRSKSDSIVMRILRSAMDKTHEKLQFKDGPIEFLHERATFYELAAILVEAGLSIVEEETDILEGSCNKIISDLTEIRQWLEGRIRDMKKLIVEKDRELAERLEKESKLRHALELKDRELVCLHEKLEPGLMKNNDIRDLPTSNQAMQDEGAGGDISKLKSSVDQQVLNIKQKLEDEKKILTAERRVRRSRASSPNLSFDFLDKERAGVAVFSEGDFSGVDKFSSTRPPNQNVLIRGMSSDIDILKGTLDLAFGRMQSAEVLPLEKQWRWGIEREIERVLVRGFISDLQQNFDVELKKKVGLVKDDWFDFISEMRALFRELKDFFAGNDARERGFSSNPSPCVRRTSSESFLDFICTGSDLLEDDAEVNGSCHVAKMMKNHESVARIQRKRCKWLMKEGCSSMIKKGKDDDRQERRIQDAITRLDNFTKTNHILADETGISYRNGRQERRISINHIETNRSSSTVEEFEVETEKLREERDGLCFQISVMEDIHQLLLRSMIDDVNTELRRGETERRMKNDSGGKESHEAADELEGSTSAQILLHCLETAMREDIYMVFFRELRSEMDACAVESFLREDVYQFVVTEAVKDANVQLTKPQVLRQFSFQERTPRSRRLNADNFQEGTPRSMKLETDGDESLIQKLDSLLRCLEAEEDLMLKASSIIKEHSVNNSLVILNCEEMDERDAIEWLITDDESTFCSVSEKLERALQQLYTSKELLVELEESLEVSDDFGEYYQQVQLNDVQSIERENAQSFLQQDDCQVSQAVLSDNVLTSITRFHQIVGDVEHVLYENLESKCLRLEVLKRRVDALAQPVAWIRTRKLLYKKAFILRCHNLRLAETEVDLLGDQVESLLYLLERIFAVLNRNATVLSGYFEVYDILKLIKMELNKGRFCELKS